ncbi:expressed protein [Echinococcus multilocularis]|uniref:Expressed protein n=1 Tax=Echinococcus multilocularis TaxID=6211 RepID=A0A068Y5S0_ECHMU|nr:expressed protein [Echinococcus multilocularis]
MPVAAFGIEDNLGLPTLYFSKAFFKNQVLDIVGRKVASFFVTLGTKCSISSYQANCVRVFKNDESHSPMIAPTLTSLVKALLKLLIWE